MSTSDFIPLDPVTFNSYYEENVPHAVVIINGAPYVPYSYRATFNGHGATDDATIVLTLSNNPDFTASLANDGGPAGNLVALPDGTLAVALPNASGGVTTTPATEAQIAAFDSGGPNTPIFVEIWAGFRNTPAATTDLSGLTQRFSGLLDAYSMAPDADEVTFTARSLASPFVDQKLTSAPMGQTSIQFVNAMAAAIGLTANIALVDGVKPITVQETLGREFVSSANFNTALFNLHPWDLMLQMALFDDVDVWVSGNTLNYIAPSKVQRTTINLTYGGDGQTPGILRPVGTHSTQLNKNIRVEVRSYTEKIKQSVVYRVDSTDPGITVTSSTKTISASMPLFGTDQVVSTHISPTGQKSVAISSGSGGGFAGTTSAASESGKMIYKVYRPNLTAQRCNQLALAMWRQYSMHEFALSFDLPVTQARLADFSITSLLRVSGLPYDAFNSHNSADMYYPRQIVESFDTTSGWMWSVHAVNSVLPEGAV